MVLLHKQIPLYLLYWDYIISERFILHHELYKYSSTECAYLAVVHVFLSIQCRAIYSSLKRSCNKRIWIIILKPRATKQKKRWIYCYSLYTSALQSSAASVAACLVVSIKFGMDNMRGDAHKRKSFQTPRM